MEVALEGWKLLKARCLGKLCMNSWFLFLFSKLGNSILNFSLSSRKWMEKKSVKFLFSIGLFGLSSMTGLDFVSCEFSQSGVRDLEALVALVGGNWGQESWAEGKRQRTVSESSYGGNSATHPPPTVQFHKLFISASEEIRTQGRLAIGINRSLIVNSRHTCIFMTGYNFPGKLVLKGPVLEQALSKSWHCQKPKRRAQFLKW